MIVDAENQERREECPSEKRRCSKCGKVLAEMNPGPECYSCSVPLVVDIDEKGKFAFHGGGRGSGSPIPENGLYLPAIHP